MLRSTAQTLTLLEPFADQLTAGLENADSQAEAERVIREVYGQVGQDDAYADQIWRTNLRANLGGQLFVRDVELGDGIVKLATGTPADSFLNLPFTEAIQNFQSRQALNIDAFNDLSDAERFRSFAMAESTSQTMTARALRQLRTAMQPGGPGLREFVTSFTPDAIPPAYLETVYRTSTAVSYNAGRFRQQTAPEVVAAGLVWRYVTALDDRVRPEHEALHGQVWAINDPQALAVYPPNGFNCFPCDTLVEGNVVAGLRALYSGQVVKLTTESGRVLFVTPNHPLATPRGFVPARLVHAGQDLLAYERNSHLVDHELVRGVDVQDAPARIEDVFRALHVGDGPSVALRPCPDDLHGDARLVDGDVNVVAVDGVLLVDRQPADPESCSNPVLSAPLPGLPDEVGHRRLPLGLDAVDTAAAGLPSPRALPLNGGPVLLQRGPLQPLRVGLSTTNDAALTKPAGDDAASDAEFLRELVLRGAGKVAADKVVKVEFDSFHGYVYDLQTVGGWMVAGGIVTSNCRCVMTVEEPDDVTDPSTNPDLSDAVTTGFGGPPGDVIEREG